MCTFVPFADPGCNLIVLRCPIAPFPKSSCVENRPLTLYRKKENSAKQAHDSETQRLLENEEKVSSWSMWLIEGDSLLFSSSLFGFPPRSGAS